MHACVRILPLAEWAELSWYFLWFTHLSFSFLFSIFVCLNSIFPWTYYILSCTAWKGRQIIPGPARRRLLLFFFSIFACFNRPRHHYHHHHLLFIWKLFCCPCWVRAHILLFSSPSYLHIFLPTYLSIYPCPVNALWCWGVILEREPEEYLAWVACTHNCLFTCSAKWKLLVLLLLLAVVPK